MSKITVACAAAFAAALSLAGAACAQSPPNFAGTWRLAEPFEPAMKTIDGKLPPMKPAAKKLYDQRIAERKAGKTKDNIEACLPPGTPRIMWQQGPFMLLQQPKKVTIVHEFQHTLRHIYLDEKLPEGDDVNFFYGGDSVGRFEGDTLVVESNGFNDQTQLDTAGLPHSPEMRVTERLRLLDKDTLENRVTITDPANYTAPWTARVTYRRDDAAELKEDICAIKLVDPALRDKLR
jgi:hypothetical protein